MYKSAAAALAGLAIATAAQAQGLVAFTHVNVVPMTRCCRPCVVLGFGIA
jgi:hypothetical protein